MFSREICEACKNNSFHRTPPVAALTVAALTVAALTEDLQIKYFLENASYIFSTARSLMILCSLFLSTTFL